MNKTFSINDLERISSIKAHTIRIWEKRYNLLTPQRTETNIRLYTEQDLKKLLMVVVLYKQGMRISEIAQLSLTRLQELVLDMKIPAEAQSTIIEQLMLGVTDFNPKFIDDIIIKEIINTGIENTFEKTIYPFLRKVELLWLTDILSGLHYDFAFNQISRFLWQNLKFTQVTYYLTHYIAIVPPMSHTMPILIYFSHILNKNKNKITFIGPTNDVTDLILSKKFANDVFLTVYNPLNNLFYQKLLDSGHKVIMIDLAGEYDSTNYPNLRIITAVGEMK